MRNKVIYLMSTFMISCLFVAGCSNPTAPPTVDFCQQKINSGIPSAIVLLYPGESPIKEISVHYDRWDIGSDPSSLVQEDSISALNGQVWQRADPVTPPADWWTFIPEEQWASNPLDSLAAVTLKWDFLPPLEASEKLVYKIQLTYITPEGNSSLTTSDRYTVTTETDFNSDSEMCQDFFQFMVGS